MSAFAFSLLQVGCYSYDAAVCVKTVDAKKKCASVSEYSHTGCCNGKENHMVEQFDAFIYTNTSIYQSK